MCPIPLQYQDVSGRDPARADCLIDLVDFLVLFFSRAAGLDCIRLQHLRGFSGILQHPQSLKVFRNVENFLSHRVSMCLRLFYAPGPGNFEVPESSFEGRDGTSISTACRETARRSVFWSGASDLKSAGWKMPQRQIKNDLHCSTDTIEWNKNSNQHMSGCKIWNRLRWQAQFITEAGIT